MSHFVKQGTLMGVLLVAGMFFPGQQSYSASCVNGAYRAGCTGQNGTAVIRKTSPTYRTNGQAHCANGAYRAGCAGPNGVAAIRK
jgi:hypothetical protein